MIIRTGLGEEEFVPVILNGENGYWVPGEGPSAFIRKDVFENFLKLGIFEVVAKPSDIQEGRKGE